MKRYNKANSDVNSKRLKWFKEFEAESEKSFDEINKKYIRKLNVEIDVERDHVHHEDESEQKSETTENVDNCNSEKEKNNNKINEVIIKLYESIYFDEKSGFILSYNSCEDGNSGLEQNCDRINKLFALAIQLNDGTISLEMLRDKILELYKENHYFILQVEMENYYPQFTPGKGLCWLISEYQAYYRGLNEPNSDIVTWEKYSHPLDQILDEAYQRMKKQRDDEYLEADKIDYKRRVMELHNHFMNAWEHQETKTKLISDGIYSNQIPEIFKKHDKMELKIDDEVQCDKPTKPMKEDGRWGSTYTFGTVFFSSEKLDSTPKVNYFVDNESLNKNTLRKGYAKLQLVLPFKNRTEASCYYSLNDLTDTMLHNNNILFTSQHFQPMDWPDALKTNEHWFEGVKAIVIKTVEILTENSHIEFIHLDKKKLKNILQKV